MVVGLFVACSGDAPEDEETPNCGGELTCADDEFCLSYLAPGAATGDEEYSCELLPSECDSFDAMCFDEPACVEDWAALFCPNAFSFGCVSFGGSDEAYCQDYDTTTSVR